MKKETKIQIALIFVLIIILGVVIYFAVINSSGSNSKNMGDPPSGSQKMMGNSDSSSVEATGATEINDTQTIENVSYTSSESDENALLIQNGGNATLSNATITKTGDSDGENSDFYGTNAGILVSNNGNLTMGDSVVKTDASHANGIFVYGTGVATISDTKINTTSNNSGGVMVAGGGTLKGTNLTIQTEGNSSAAIRSDRGGGTMDITKGTYTTNGVGSPVIYSTADVTVNDAILTSTKSEGVVVEGANSVTLNNVTLEDTNTTLNGNSTTYKNIFLYQSMSGDADTGTANFTAKDSTIKTNKGDVFYITNTVATINLTNNQFINNNDGDFLRVEAAAWGKNGSNGGTVTLNSIKQEIIGNIIIDNISTLDMKLTEGSYYEGTINGDNSAKEINITLDKTSKIKLTGDIYVTSLTDEDSSYSNIDFNGYKLYVNGTSIN